MSTAVDKWILLCIPCQGYSLVGFGGGNPPIWILFPHNSKILKYFLGGAFPPTQHLNFKLTIFYGVY